MAREPLLDFDCGERCVCPGLCGARCFGPCDCRRVPHLSRFDIIAITIALAASNWLVGFSSVKVRLRPGIRLFNRTIYPHCLAARLPCRHTAAPKRGAPRAPTGFRPQPFVYTGQLAHGNGPPVPGEGQLLGRAGTMLGADAQPRNVGFGLRVWLIEPLSGNEVTLTLAPSDTASALIPD